MKNFKDMPDELVIQVATLALHSLLNFDFVISTLRGQRDLDYKLRIEREDYSENLQVIRTYIDGMPGCYCAIWEEDLNVDTYQDNDVCETANQMEIFKLFQKEGYLK